MKDKYFDALLNINTRGEQRGFNKSLHYHHYEPTPYGALELLFKQYEINSSDRIVDFGCGKGRLIFYVHHICHASVVGIEMNRDLFDEAVKNQERYLRKNKNANEHIHLYCCLAQEYEINLADNRFYFFNPFSIQIFIKIINNILFSLEKSVRDVELVLYYPSEDYIYFLEKQTPFELKTEVILPVLYDHNSNERFLIYKLNLD